jgi:predicted aspartyl protease
LWKSVDLIKEEQHRVKFRGLIYHRQGYGVPINIMLDTGCFNTLIDKKMAEKFGELLPDTKRKFAIGGKKVEAEAYVMHKLSIATFPMIKVTMFAVDFTGHELEDSILLGANIFNNWKFTIHRSENKMAFEQSIPDIVPYKEFPYMNYFDREHKYEMMKQFC